MRSFNINSNDAGQRLDRFLSKVAPNLPQSLLQKYLRKKRIKLNRGRCEAGTRLSEGDLLELYIGDEFFPSENGGKSFPFESLPEPKIVFEDENLVVMDKPTNLACHSGDKPETTLVDMLVAHLWRTGEFSPDSEASFTPALCNRLDRNTRGLVIGAKNAAALRAVNELIRNGGAVKKYLCVTSKKPAEGIFVEFMRKNASLNKTEVRERSFDGASEVKTGVRVVTEKNGLFLVEITLFTGYSHQIRAHLSGRGCPIIGDVKYGGEKLYGYSMQALCAYSLKLDFPEASPFSCYRGMVFRLSEPPFSELGFNTFG